MNYVLDFIKENKFRAIFIALLILSFVIILEGGKVATPTTETAQTQELKKEAHVFFLPTCPHCHAEFAFLDKIKIRYPDIKIIKHDVSDSKEVVLMMDYANKFGLDPNYLGTPFLIYNNEYIVGFGNDETTGREIETLFNKTKTLAKAEAPKQAAKEEIKVENNTITLPLFGQVDLVKTSLPVLAIILGFIDGFNPCAMWVLVYLISIIIEMKDRKKIYTLVGTFLAASGILYFLFMTAWLNLFLLIGYVHAITLAIGLFAIYFGAMSIYSYLASGGHVACDLIDFKTQQKTRSKIKQLVTSPMNIATFFGMVVLAFAINSIEFVCSSALPAIFTQVLANANISTAAHYMYILLYDLFFMLDDIIIFTLAAVAVDKFVGDKYADICKIIGGAIMICLGIMMTFFPEFLR